MKWLNVDQAAAYLGLSKRAVYDRVYRGTLPSHRLGRLLRFNQDELDQLLLTGSSQADQAVLQQALARLPGGKDS